jgi:hypothetical protein
MQILNKAIILLFVLTLFNCRKDEVSPVLPTTLENESNRLIGEWEWEFTMVYYQAFGPGGSISGEQILSDTLPEEHSVKIYDFGKIEFVKNQEVERFHYFKLDHFEKPFFSNDSSQFYFKLLLDNDTNQVLSGYIADEPFYDGFKSELKFLWGYPEPNVDTTYDIHETFYYRK